MLEFYYFNLTIFQITIGRRWHLRVPRAQQVVGRHEELQVRLRHQPRLDEEKKIINRRNIRKS